MFTRWTAAALVLCAAAASADIYLEVTRTGEQADGFWDDAVFGEIGSYDLWLYADAPGVDLWGITFDIAGTPAEPGTQWEVTSLGSTDPGGLFQFFTNDGLIVEGGIIEASASANLPGVFDPVALPDGPPGAILLYEGFAATNLEPQGRLFADAVFLLADPDGQAVVSIGIVQTPAPGTIVLVGLMAVPAVRRRR